MLAQIAPENARDPDPSRSPEILPDNAWLSLGILPSVLRLLLHRSAVRLYFDGNAK
jgi:hypothetical protein